ncbi:MAG: isochorismatase family protein [Nocardioides sp.]|uniref:isochorismatase family protein n=1 Tax=Nocardioides sp. TaxID=35761 RepID=UPI003D6A55B5
MSLHTGALGTDDIGWVWDLYRLTLHADHAEATGRTDDELYAAQLAALATGSVSVLLDGDGARVGFIRVTDDGPDLTIRDLAIQPDQQGRSFGSAAVASVATRAAAVGQDVVLRVLHANPRARSLYERLGFEVDEERSRSTQMRLRAPGVHRWAIPEREYTRQESRRGRRHAYEGLDPATTALVVVDLVPFFYEANATCYAITPNVRLLADALRDAGGAVAWVVPGDPGQTAWAREFLGDEVAELFRRSGGTGPVAGRLGPGLDAREDDMLVEKTATSALFPGSSTLDDQLRERDIETVVVTGTLTEVCVAGTARDAATLGYRTLVVADATAGRDDESHNATLTTIYRTFGDVRPTDDVLGLIAAGGSVAT